MEEKRKWENYLTVWISKVFNTNIKQKNRNNYLNILTEKSISQGSRRDKKNVNKEGKAFTVQFM